MLTISCFPPVLAFLTFAPTLALTELVLPAPFTPDPPMPDPRGTDEGGGGCPEKAASSLGTISMRKSKWSDLVRALAISALDNVRRLLESATMNARPVISAMNTKDS